MPETNTPAAIKARRKQSKLKNVQYREKASTLFPGLIISPHAHVSPAEGGAFVEVVVWVPDDERAEDAYGEAMRAMALADFAREP
jgi:hypothetical protein